MYLTLIWLVLAPWPFLSVYVSYPDLIGFSSLAVPICLCILPWFDWFYLLGRSYLSMYLTLIWVVLAPWPFLSVYVSYPDLSGFSYLAVPICLCILPYVFLPYKIYMNLMTLTHGTTFLEHASIKYVTRFYCISIIYIQLHLIICT